MILPLAYHFFASFHQNLSFVHFHCPFLLPLLRLALVILCLLSLISLAACCVCRLNLGFMILILSHLIQYQSTTRLLSLASSGR